jgi:hypothetical protein
MYLSWAERRPLKSEIEMTSTVYGQGSIFFVGIAVQVTIDPLFKHAKKAKASSSEHWLNSVSLVGHRYIRVSKISKQITMQDELIPRPEGKFQTYRALYFLNFVCASYSLAPETIPKVHVPLPRQSRPFLPAPQTSQRQYPHRFNLADLDLYENDRGYSRPRQQSLDETVLLRIRKDFISLADPVFLQPSCPLQPFSS